MSREVANGPATNRDHDPVIRLDHVSFSYAGGSGAGLEDVDLSVEAGEVVLLCGDSGCGKTTLTRLINGLIPHYFDGRLHGSVMVDGLDVAHAELSTLTEHVGSVFQNPKSQFFTLNVSSELAFACENLAVPPEEIGRRIASTANDFHIQSLLGRPMLGLSGGQQQQVACASSSMASPDVLVLDEPSSNLDAAGIADLRRIVSLWKSRGKTVVIAEHRLYWLDGLIDRVVYLNGGRIARTMTGNELHDMPEYECRLMGLRSTKSSRIVALANAMPPIRTTHTARSTTTRSEDSYLAKDFGYTYRHAAIPALRIPAVELPSGTVIAVVGGNGAGKTTFARCLQGLDRRCQGVLYGPGPRREPYRRRRRLRVCFTVLQDVNRELFTESVLDEVLLAQPHEDCTMARKILDDLDLTDVAERHPLSLSGGQKQRVAIATALACERPIVIFDEPTSGLDMRHMRQVAQLIHNLASHGRTVVVITHDPEFALLACDDAIVVKHGEVDGMYRLNAKGATRLCDELVAQLD